MLIEGAEVGSGLERGCSGKVQGRTRNGRSAQGSREGVEGQNKETQREEVRKRASEGTVEG